MARRILGLDPGLQTTGYALIELTAAGPSIIEAGVIRSTEARDPAADLATRLRALYDGVCEVLDQGTPTLLAIEQLYAHYEHPRTAILMGHARGCYLLAAAQRNIDVLSLAATTVKKTITGSGRATKEQMQAAMMREYQLAKLPEPHDVADALAIALCGYYLTAKNLASGTRGIQVRAVNQALFERETDDEL